MSTDTHQSESPLYSPNEKIRLSEYVLAIRPKLGFYALFGVLTFMFYFREDVSWPCIGAGSIAALLTSAIMVWNDYFDREHDVQKGRTLAHRDPRAFLIYVGLIWGTSLTGIGVVSWDNRAAGLVLVAMAVIGWLYGWFRTVPFMSGMAVALSFGGLVPLAASYAPGIEPGRVWLLFICVTAMAYGRETIADLDDIEIDQAYKATLPVMVGEVRARWFVRTCTVLSIGLACYVTPWTCLFLPFTAWVLFETTREQLAFSKIQKIYDVQSVGFMLLLPWA